MNDELNNCFDIKITRAPINYVGGLEDEHTKELKKEYAKHLRTQRKTEREAAKLNTKVKRVKIE